MARHGFLNKVGAYIFEGILGSAQKLAKLIKLIYGFFLLSRRSRS